LPKGDARGVYGLLGLLAEQVNNKWEMVAGGKWELMARLPVYINTCCTVEE
jgi:hypothetical protein